MPTKLVVFYKVFILGCVSIPVIADFICESQVKTKSQLVIMPRAKHWWDL
jgi:hypothetical protein